MINLTLPSLLNLYSETIVKTTIELEGVALLSFPGIDALQASGVIITPLFATIFNNSDQSATNMRILKETEFAGVVPFTVDPLGAGHCFYFQEGGFPSMAYVNPLGAVFLEITIAAGVGSLTFTIYYKKTNSTV